MEKLIIYVPLYLNQQRVTRLSRSSLTLFCLLILSTLINWTNLFPILGVSGVLFHFLYEFLYASSVDPDQMQHSVASGLGLQGLPMS